MPKTNTTPQQEKLEMCAGTIAGATQPKSHGSVLISYTPSS
jgi:hypothetical protein